MRSRIRIATAVGALGAACVLLLPLATGAGAATPQVSDYTMSGVARGLSFGFGFKDFVLAKILDVGIPHASNELNTSAGATAMAEAAIAYPGDVFVGALHRPDDPNSLPGGLPGYSVSKYPPGQSSNRNVTNSLFGNEIPLPNSAGQIGLDNGHLETAARERLADASTTTQRFILGDAAAPLLTVGGITSKTSAKVEAGRVTQVARTAVSDIVLTPSADLTIVIGSVVSEAVAFSNGTTGDGNATMTVSGVRVISGTNVYAATIDNKGIHLTGLAPEDAPNSLAVNPGQSLDAVAKGLQNSGVSLRTAEATRVIDGASSDMSIGGLVIGLDATIPRIPVVQQLITQILAPITEPIKPQCGVIPNFPVCISPNLIPTGGNGTLTSLAIGSVDAVSAASTGFVQTPVGGGDGGFAPGPVGDLGPGVPPGDFGNGTTPPGQQPTQTGTPRLFGLVAKMPAGALLGGGLAFLVIAVAMTIGPSLRQWRSAT